MSLLSGMNNMMTNQAALEAANDELLFMDEITTESDELIDTMVDCKKINCESDDEDIDQMLEEDDEEDEINQELDDEDNSIAAASEAAVPTGSDFLRSLLLDDDDPITTHPGSIGYSDSAATFTSNFSSEFDDDDDHITTDYGSIGSRGSSANHDHNFASTAYDDNDPITTNFGSIGQKNSTAKDPVIESAMFFGEILGEEAAMEGFIQKIKDKSNARKTKQRIEDLHKLGISQDIPREKVNQLLEQKKYDGAVKVVTNWIRGVENVQNKISDEDPEAKAKRKIANRMIKSATAFIIKIQVDQEMEKNMLKGMKHGEARRKAKATIKARAKNADAATESFIMDCIGMVEAYESEVQDMDPEATSDGAIGQGSSKASFDGNYSDGDLDENDPSETRDGAEGQEDSAATFNDNFSDGDLDDDDPISGIYGSVGQKDSTAKDPAVESSLDDELSSLSNMLDDVFDYEDDDLF